MKTTLAALAILLAGCSTSGASQSGWEQELARVQQEALERRADAIAQLGWSAWTYAGSTCADGWQSPSIGKSGACSWHGGVVQWYKNDADEYLSCRNGLPPDPEEAVEQINAIGRIYCAY